MASLRFDDDLKKGLIPEQMKILLTKLLLKKLSYAAIRSYLSDKCKSDEESPGKETKEENLGPLTSLRFEGYS